MFCDREEISRGGGLKNAKSRFYSFVDVAPQAASILKTHDIPFVDVALRASSILKKHVFFCLIGINLPNS